MSRSRNLLLGSALTFSVLAGPAVAEKLGLGREALPEEIAAWDVAALPDGTGLPEGSGDVAAGEGAADVKVMLHCCGGVRPLLGDLIEAGLDAINPVQVSCVGMAPRELKVDFGARLTFWGGGCDTHFVLPRATPGEIRRHVHGQIAILKPGGGFVFQQVHNILADVPPENIIAMFDAVNGAAPTP